MKHLRLGILAVLAAGFGFVAGCSGDPNQPTTEVSPEIQQRQATLQELHQQSGGDWNRLSPEQQKDFADRFVNGRIDLAPTEWAALMRDMQAQEAGAQPGP